jgi:hypothetical protein
MMAARRRQGGALGQSEHRVLWARRRDARQPQRARAARTRSGLLKSRPLPQTPKNRHHWSPMTSTLRPTRSAAKVGSIKITLRPAVFDDHVFSLDIPGFAEAPLERGHTWRKHARRLAAEKADHRHCLLFRAKQPSAPAVPPASGSSSSELSRSGGVITPPVGVDPQMKQTPPPSGDSMPVVPPPGTPGGNPAIKPK